MLNGQAGGCLEDVALSAEMPPVCLPSMTGHPIWYATAGATFVCLANNFVAKAGRPQQLQQWLALHCKPLKQHLYKGTPMSGHKTHVHK